jgi:hypothetical protein
VCARANHSTTPDLGSIYAGFKKKSSCLVIDEQVLAVWQCSGTSPNDATIAVHVRLVDPSLSSFCFFLFFSSSWVRVCWCARFFFCFFFWGACLQQHGDDM